MTEAPLAELVGLTLPQTLAGHAAPFCTTLQVTPLFVTSFVTVAVNLEVTPTARFAAAGLTETEIMGTVMIAEPLAVGSSTEVAVMVTDGETGAFAGAV